MKGEYEAIFDSGLEIQVDSADIDALNLTKIDQEHYHALASQKSINIQILSADFGSKEFIMRVNGEQVHIRLRDSVEAMVHNMGLDEVSGELHNVIAAPMPGLVLDIRAEVGMPVSEGEPLVILEAMKMENVLTAPCDGIVMEVNAKPGQPVDKAQVLVVLDTAS